MNQPAHLQHPEHDSTMDDVFGEFRKIMSRARRAARQAQQAARQSRNAQHRAQQQRSTRRPEQTTKERVDAPRSAAEHIADLVGRWAAAHAAAEAAHAAADDARTAREEADTDRQQQAERADTDVDAADAAAQRADAYAAAWDERMRAEGLDPDTLPREDVAADTELSPAGETVAHAAEALAEEFTADQLENPDAATDGLDGSHKNVGDLIADAHPEGNDLTLDGAGTDFDPGVEAAGAAAELGAGVDTGVGVGQ